MIDNDKITNSQLSAVIALTIIGVGVFPLPRVVAETAGNDGWITVILGGLIAIAMYYLYSRIARKFPGDTLVEVAYKVLGKYLAIPALLAFWAYILSIIAITLRISGEVFKQSLLLRTPIEVIMITFLIVCFMLSRGGIEPIARFDEIVFPLILITVIFIALASIPGSDFTNLLPVMRTDPLKILQGAYQTTYAYGGFEFVLLIIPFLKKPDKMFKSTLSAFTVVIVTYILAVILSFGKFGADDTKELIWPSLTLIRTISIPGSFIERLEGIIMSLWILFAFTTVAPFIYGSAVIPSRMLGHSEFKHFCSIVIPLIYIAAIIPDNVVEAYRYQDLITQYLGVFSIFILPITILAAASIRKMGVKEDA